MIKNKSLKNKKCISFQVWSQNLYKQKIGFKTIMARRFMLIQKKSKSLTKKVRQSNKESQNDNSALDMNKAY